MLDSEGVAKYWKEQTKKGDNPCHYHNKWQDRYAFNVRVKALQSIDFSGVTEVVDVGCGIGEYTAEIAKMTSASIFAFDFPFNIEIAQKKFNNQTQITFLSGSVPDEVIRQKIESADLVILTTVFVHFSPEARSAFYMYIQHMKPGARVVLLEYIPYKIPDFQKNLEYKKIDTVDTLEKSFAQQDFALKGIRHINFIDSFLFYHLGTNAFVYGITLWADTFLRLIGYTKSKYKMLTFIKK